MLDPYFRIGEQKRSFCEAVNWSLCDQEGKFLFAMLVPSHDFITAIESSAWQSIWLACVSKTFKDEVTGMEDSSLQKAPRWEELEERWAPYYVMVLCDGIMWWYYVMAIILWKTICIWILYVLSHDVSNALFSHVTTDCRKSFSEKQEVFLINKSRHVWWKQEVYDEMGLSRWVIRLSCNIRWTCIWSKVCQ